MKEHPSSEKRALRKVLKAWESLPTGHYQPYEIAVWLQNTMRPAITSVRRVLARESK